MLAPRLAAAKSHHGTKKKQKKTKKNKKKTKEGAFGLV
jgi:hypothetical protein